MSFVNIINITIRAHSNRINKRAIFAFFREVINCRSIDISPCLLTQ